MEDMPRTEEERIRRAFAMVGQAAGDKEPDDKPVRRLRRRRTYVNGVLVAAAAVTAIAVGGTVLAGLGDDDDPGAPQQALGPHEGAQGQTTKEYVACARTIVTGDILNVDDGNDPGRFNVTIAVDDWIKPATGDQRITVSLEDDRSTLAPDPWKPRENVLIYVPESRRVPADLYSGGEAVLNRKQIQQALPQAHGLKCPRIWQQG